MINSTTAQILIEHPRKFNGFDCVSEAYAHEMSNETLKAELTYILLLKDDDAGLKDITIGRLVKELNKRYNG